MLSVWIFVVVVVGQYKPFCCVGLSCRLKLNIEQFLVQHWPSSLLLRLFGCQTRRANLFVVSKIAAREAAVAITIKKSDTVYLRNNIMQYFDKRFVMGNGWQLLERILQRYKIHPMHLFAFTGG